MLLVDDGLQHVSLRRDLSLLCVDSSYLLGNEQVLSGPLREPLGRALARADAVLAVDPAATTIAPAAVALSSAAEWRARHDGGGESRLRAELALPASMPLLRAALEPEPAAAAVLAGR